MREPRTDPAVSAQFGVPIEALDGIAALQPRPSGRWKLSHAALEHLWGVRNRGLVTVAARRSAAGTELRDAGLTGRFGALSDDGERFVRLLDRPDARFGASASLHGRSAQWSMWLGGGSALVRAQGSVVDLVAGDAEPDVSRFDILAAGRAVGHLMAWTALTPAWVVDSGAALVVPTEHVQRRVDGEAVPAPDTSDPLVHRLWKAPTWTRLRVWSEATGRGTEWISAGVEGVFRAIPLGDGLSCRIERIPGGTVFRDVLSVFDAVPSAGG